MFHTVIQGLASPSYPAWRRKRGGFFDRRGLSVSTSCCRGFTWRCSVSCARSWTDPRRFSAGSPFLNEGSQRRLFRPQTTPGLLGAGRFLCFGSQRVCRFPITALQHSVFPTHWSLASETHFTLPRGIVDRHPSQTLSNFVCLKCKCTYWWCDDEIKKKKETPLSVTLRLSGKCLKIYVCAASVIVTKRYVSE